ncbi:MAG: hypothetical protein ACLP3K_10915 [Candidatus Acidiferrales bacterium]
MTGRAYYVTTLADWRRHAARFANSHFVVLGGGNESASAANDAQSTGDPSMPRADTKILVLIEADEGVHLSLEDEPAFEPLPHPLAQKPLSPAVHVALEPHGVAPGATTFDAAETLGRIHPLLGHRVF